MNVTVQESFMTIHQYNQDCKAIDAEAIVTALMPWLTSEAEVRPKLVAGLAKIPAATLKDLAMGASFITGRRNRIACEAAEEGIIISDQSLPNLGRKTQ